MRNDAIKTAEQAAFPGDFPQCPLDQDSHSLTIRCCVSSASEVIFPTEDEIISNAASEQIGRL
jgi:hypothetical protein